MKSCETIKELYPKLNSLLAEVDNEVKDQVKKIKKEVNSKIIDEKIQLLKIISKGEKMDFNDLAIKYLTERERKQIKIYEIPEIDEKLLDIVKIEGVSYYYDTTGNIFNSKSIKVGTMKNGVPIMN